MGGAEHFDVLIVGAGLSGIGAAHHLLEKTPWLSFAIVESRDAIGGTWDLFRYPGVRSDSDMFTLGYGFRPWDGEDAIADGASIRDYIVATAEADGTVERIRFGQKATTAAWSSDDAAWTIEVEAVATGDTSTVTCGFLYSCTGYYRYDRGYLPEWDGYADFEGTTIHPQHWPKDVELSGKNVVVIGSGATAVTLVPALAADAGHVTMLQRSPTYVVSASPLSPLKPGGSFAGPKRSLMRWLYAIGGVVSYWGCRTFPKTTKKLVRRGVTRHLPDGYDVDTHFTPPYEPWDQRMCMVPDADLFTAVSNGEAEIVTDHIDAFTATGIRLRSGAHLDADIVVTATGLEMLFLGGIALSVDGTEVISSDRLIYKGTMLEGVPNFAFAFGYTNASWTLKCELSAAYVTDVLTRMRDTGLRQATPVQTGGSVAPQDFLDLTSGYVRRGAGRFPKSGDTFPWQVHQNYLRDYRAMRLNAVDDGILTLTNPTPLVSARAATSIPAPQGAPA